MSDPDGPQSSEDEAYLKVCNMTQNSRSINDANPSRLQLPQLTPILGIWDY